MVTLVTTFRFKYQLLLKLLNPLKMQAKVHFTKGGH